MTKQKVGLVLFWISVIWAILWGVIGSVLQRLSWGDSTLAEVNKTIWAMDGPLSLAWIMAVPLSAVIAMIGVLLYAGAKGKTVLKYGTGVFLGLVVGMLMINLKYIPALFGIGGTLILLSFIGILWLWAKERKAIKKGSTTPGDLRLVGYLFFLIAAWFICGIASLPFINAFKDLGAYSPIHIMVFLVLGWVFMFLSHYKASKQ